MTTAGDMLTAAIRDLAGDIRGGRDAAVAGEPDAVHQLRTSVRRLRNLLAAFRRCLDSTAAAELGAALASYGGLLGECRDLEVRAADTTAALDALGLADELGDALAGPLLARHAAAQDALIAWHAGPGVVALDRLLVTWSDAPALARRARRPAADVATKAVRRQVRRVLTRADAVVAAEDVEEARHALRKAARRLRHTADAVAPVTSAASIEAPVQGLGKLGHQVQGALGDHRDALLLAEHVRRCAAGAPEVAGRASYDRVVRHAEELATEALAGLDDTLATLRERAIS